MIKGGLEWVMSSSSSHVIGTEDFLQIKKSRQGRKGGMVIAQLTWMLPDCLLQQSSGLNCATQLQGVQNVVPNHLLNKGGAMDQHLVAFVDIWEGLS